MKTTATPRTETLKLNIPQGVNPEEVAARKKAIMDVNPDMYELHAEEIALTAATEQAKHNGRTTKPRAACPEPDPEMAEVDAGEASAIAASGAETDAPKSTKARKGK